jgi:hypothetical protein
MVIQNIVRVLVSALIFAACTNPFSTRTVEKPDADKNSDTFDQPTRSEVVLSNLQHAVNEKNVSNYMSCFIDTSLIPSFTYRFKPDESIPTEPFHNWSLEDEENYLRNVFNKFSTVHLDYIDQISFTPISSAIDSVQTAPFTYQLTVTAGQSILLLYSGVARMKLVKNSNSLWAIYYWEDTRDAENNTNTWSLLKADYRIN